jgi:hypothetical protein
MRRPKKILVAFIKATVLASLQQTGWAGDSLVEKPKVGELQMDWLRSEDLKEEKTQPPQESL